MMKSARGIDLGFEGHTVIIRELSIYVNNETTSILTTRDIGVDLGQPVNVYVNRSSNPALITRCRNGTTKGRSTSA